MGNKKSKNLRDLIIDLREQVMQSDDMTKIIGGTSKHQISQGDRGCGGIVPQ